MNREIKFRAWLPDMKQIGPVTSLKGSNTEYKFFRAVVETFDAHKRQIFYETSDFVLMQFTGLKDKNGKEIYDGDIFRVEEDGEDLIYYLVIVWVKEWCMFATLRADDEYPAYLSGGVDALDEPMFWTYTLNDTTDRRFFLCGNIYQDAHLLNP